ncbi:pyridoxal-phosphate dependent enzyme [Streptosporangium sp. NPDC049644]|uniref:pyridoxal-phosphate dependent enzyme n=1 Tax=Streptosporangium sp. NPDC049644 TaxID=3155507 RepID=UPI00342725B2
MSAMDAPFTLIRPDENGPAVLWGGVYESGSLKYLTYELFLEEAPQDVRGFVEISGSSTALALDLLGRKKGLPTVAITDASGRDHLMRRGFRGEVRTITNLDEAHRLCLQYEQEGWFWPRQFTNVALVRCVELWGLQLLRKVRKNWPEIRYLVCGFGTGATVAGLYRVFAPFGYSVMGLQARPGDPVPGWRNYALQNLGDQDLFHCYQEKIPLPIPSETESSGAGALDSLLRYANTYANPEQVLVISHDGRPRDRGLSEKVTSTTASASPAYDELRR